MSDAITPELETVARAIHAAMQSHWGIETFDVSEADIDTREICFAQARAALLAIREPTDGMRDRAYNACAMDDQWCIEDDDHWAQTHRAAIDYVLGGKP